MPAGRKTGYKPEFVDQARKLCELGATDKEIADFFEVSDRTIYRWQVQFHEFCQALKAGKEAADERVARSLYHRATGYSFQSEKVFQYQGQIVRTETTEHIPPDTTAMIFWLKNRRPKEWRDKSEVVHRHSVENMTDDELAAIASGSSEGASKAPINPTKLN
jgi:hypothetical protein